MSKKAVALHFGFLILFVAIILAAINVYYNTNTISKINRGCNSCQMYKDISNNTPNFGFDGIFKGTGYYCVWTQDNDGEKIKNVENHEICHNLVWYDKEHFCNVSY